MSKYEFVSKKEYTPFRNEIEGIIKKVQVELRKLSPKITFQFHLVGSGGRNLITRIKGGNTGYDFDYNLEIKGEGSWLASIREEFFKAFQKAIKGTSFNRIENSTSVITIKKVSTKDSKVLVGCDFSVIIHSDGDDPSFYEYSRYDKGNNCYIWNVRNLTRLNDDKLIWLENHIEGVWTYIKEEYLKLKESDKQDKHSFILYHEAINNIFDQCYEEDDDD